MSRPLTVFLPITFDLLAPTEDVLLDDPGTWLPEASRAEPDVWRATVHLGPVSREVMCEVGPIRDEPGSLWRDLAWTPVPHAGDRIPIHQALPSFEGEIGLHRPRAVLVLNGAYDVPGGRLGELTDALALNGAARSTATRFLADVARHAAPASAARAG
ncbi:MAG TPA: hypothetical protein VGA69_10840 [Nitriliruptorales bacterium]